MMRWISIGACALSAVAAGADDWADRRAEAASLRDRTIRECQTLPRDSGGLDWLLPSGPETDHGHLRSTPPTLDWPVPPYALPVISIRVRAVVLADDNGQRRIPMTIAQVQMWVNNANQILASSAIFLDFRPVAASGDFELANSTLLNSMTGNSDPNWNQAVSAGATLASQYPDRMLVLFRWGPGSQPTGGGFSWSDLAFIAMPGFDYTTVCGVQNGGMLAHETGHYLGLPHTFTNIYSTIFAAQTAFVNAGNDAQIFNNDGRDETAPDPFVNTSTTQCLASSIALNGVTFQLPRTNAMSYYHPISEFTPSQSATMRQVLLLRSGQPLARALAGPSAGVFEGEGRSWSRSGGTLVFQTMNGFLGRWSGNRQALWIDAPQGGTLTTSIFAPRVGRYRVFASFTAAPDFGVHQHSINGQISDPVDLYSNLVLPTGPVYLGTFQLNMGSNTWRVTAVGSHPLAIKRNGYGLDYILLEHACPADLNNDNQVDDADFSIFVVAYDLLDCADPTMPAGCPADLNTDGVVNDTDFGVFVVAYNDLVCP
jgi:hypothetical protein